MQYPRKLQIKSLNDLKQIPLRSPNGKNSTPLDSVVKLTPIESPTEVDHYQLRRVIDLYVAPATENLGGVTKGIQKVLKDAHLPEGVHVDLRGSVQGMNQSFTSFGLGLILSVILVFLIHWLRQFQSFIDPFADFAGNSSGYYWRHRSFVGDRHDSQRDVPDGGGHDGGYRRL